MKNVVILFYFFALILCFEVAYSEPKNLNMAVGFGGQFQGLTMVVEKGFLEKVSAGGKIYSVGNREISSKISVSPKNTSGVGIAAFSSFFLLASKTILGLRPLKCLEDVMKGGKMMWRI